MAICKICGREEKEVIQESTPIYKLCPALCGNIVDELARFEMDDGKKCNLYSAPSNILILEIIEEEDEGIIVIVKKIKAFRTRKNFLYVQFLDNTKRKIGHFIECH